MKRLELLSAFDVARCDIELAELCVVPEPDEEEIACLADAIDSCL
jgi:hypothetical protein